jgi:hypothetical protein
MTIKQYFRRAYRFHEATHRLTDDQGFIPLTEDEIRENSIKPGDPPADLFRVILTKMEDR